MNLLKRVATALAMMLCITALRAGVADLPVKTINGKAWHYYEVQPKETLYSLQRILGVDRATIVKYNPSVEDGLQAYQVLYFPAELAEATRRETSSEGATTHVVKKGESVYGIARQYNMSVDRLIELNPRLNDGAKAGQTIIVEPSAPVRELPAAAVEEILGATAVAEPVEEAAIEEHPVKPQQYIDDARALEPFEYEEPVEVVESEVPPKSLAIAALLPLMLNEDPVSKQAARYTEFFKGMVLAVDSLNSSRQPVTLYAFDTSASIDTVRHLLRTVPQLRNASVIIAPPDDAQLKAVARFANENDIMVINPFLMRDESYLTDSHAMQAGVPSAAMIDAAVRGIVKQYGDRTPVILRRSGAKGEHSDFVAALRTAFEQAGKNAVTVTFSDELTTANLSHLSRLQGDILIVPTDGKLTELNKVLPALSEYAESLADPSRLMLVGYPEWITFRGDTRQSLNKLNTVIYSRFFADYESMDSRKADEQFTRWYGSAPEDALPRQGYLGLDLGMFLINSLRANGGDFTSGTPVTDGIQNGYRFEQVPGGGWVNTLVYLINYRPSGWVDKTIVY